MHKRTSPSCIFALALEACSNSPPAAAPVAGPAADSAPAEPTTEAIRAPAPVAEPSPEASATAEAIHKSWNFGDPRGSEQRFRELSRQALEQGDATAALELETQVARAQGLDHREDDARTTLASVEAKLASQPARVRVRVLLERGRLLNSSGQPEPARPLFEQAWQLARAEGLDALAIDAAHMVAITLLAKPDDAIAWNEKALALARASAQPAARRWLGSLLNNQGWSYFDKQEYSRALSLFEEALQFRAAQANSQATRIAKWSVGKALRALGEIDRALAIQEALLAEYAALGRDNGFVFEELGECYLIKGDAGRSRAYFAKAYAELAKDDHLEQSEPQRLQRIGHLGGVLRAREGGSRPR